MRFSLALALPLGTLTVAHARPAPVSPRADPVVWKIDVNHSELTFKIRHFTSRVRGQFNKWEGAITSPSESSFNGGTVEVTIDASSIDTNNERRDSDLRSDDFFDVTKYPTITFKSTNAEVKGNELALAGDLTMKGITKPVVLKGSYNGVATDDRGRPRAGFEASGTINRLDWDVTWNRAIEGGGMMLGDEVTIEVAIEAIRAPTGAQGR